MMTTEHGKFYCFGSGDGSFIKMGFTAGSLIARKRQLLHGQLSAVDLILLVAVPSAANLEPQIHSYFADCRNKDVNSTETYHPAPKLIEYINWLRQQWWVYLDETASVDTPPAWNEWMPTPDRRVGFLEEDPWDLIPRHLTYKGPLAGTPWNKLSTPTPASGEDFYTDPDIVNAAREAMGGIDLDAASHWYANQTHKIPHYFHLGRSAHEHDWTTREGGRAKVWLNPPYGHNAPWFATIRRNWDAGHIEQLCMISPIWAFTTQQAFPIMLLSSAMVLLSPTPSFWGNPQGRKGTNHPHGIIYLGDHPKRFTRAFRRYGIPVHLDVTELRQCALELDKGDTECATQS